MSDFKRTADGKHYLLLRRGRWCRDGWSLRRRQEYLKQFHQAFFLEELIKRVYDREEIAHMVNLESPVIHGRPNRDGFFFPVRAGATA